MLTHEPRAGAPSAPQPDPKSARTVWLALCVNLTVAAAKLGAGFVTRSSAMVAEGWHACADTANQLVLLRAHRSAARPPDDRHPLGHGRAAYFWALIAALGVFTIGGLLSLFEGYRELVDPTPATAFVLGYGVLAVALLLEAVSFTQAARALHREAVGLGRGFFQHVILSSEPTTRAVFAEDAAAVVGNVVALVGLALHQVTGSAVPDAIASLIIGVLLVVVGLGLAVRNRDFLIGESLPPGARTGAESLILSFPPVRSVRDLLLVFSGPRRATLIAHVDLDDELTAPEIEDLLADVAAALRDELPILERVELVPSGA